MAWYIVKHRDNITFTFTKLRLFGFTANSYWGLRRASWLSVITKSWASHLAVHALRQLILPLLWEIATGCHGDEDSIRCTQSYDSVQWCGRIPTFRSTFLSSSSELKTPGLNVVGYQRFEGHCWLHLYTKTLVFYHINTRRDNPEDLDLFIHTQLYTSLNISNLQNSG